MHTPATPNVVYLTTRPKRHLQSSAASNDPQPVPAPSPLFSDTLASSTTQASPQLFLSTSFPGGDTPQSFGLSSPAPTLSISFSDTLEAIASSTSLAVSQPPIISQPNFVPTTTVTVLPEPQTIASFIQSRPVCIGHGLDASSIGLLSTILVPTVIGLLLWLSFAIVRPRYREVYSLREWFVPQSLRPKPLARTFWAFMFPPLPLVPPVPTRVDEAGHSAGHDAELFPSDELLMQRVLWVCFLVVLGWSVLSLAGLLPLYTVSIPCLAESAQVPVTGAYSVLQDLSLLRLIQLLKSTSVDTDATVVSREVINSQEFSPKARTRVIISTVLTIVGLLPALWKIIREFDEIVAYRYRWTEVRCRGQEMGWLSARSSPGFVGWGEKRLKSFLTKAGLSVSLESPIETDHSRSRPARRHQDRAWESEERASLEIDVQKLFSIGDTTQLAILIEERDEILENLEIAEAKYISSFKLSTPDPSIADFAPVVAPATGTIGSPRPYISHPRPLAGTINRRRRRNPAFGSSSLPPPTSYVMPSQYYKLRRVEGLSGGHFTETGHPQGPSLAESFNSRVVGSRFQEVNRNSEAFGRLPIGSQVVMEKSGHFAPVQTEAVLPDTALYGPNGHSSWDTTAFNEGLPTHHWYSSHGGSETIREEPEEDWVDVLHEAPEAFEHGEEYDQQNTSNRRPRPPRGRNNGDTSSERRETFPLRSRGPAAEDQPPPHLRIQPRQPFVRPLSGLNHDDLGRIYADINLWRSRLKGINNEINQAQSECYSDIAGGVRVKGWLLLGKGLRFIPGIQLIEGRAKEDVRWDELQNEGGFMRRLAFWTILFTVVVLLAISLTAVAGLSLSSAPNFAHYVPFLRPISGNGLGAGVAAGLAPALGAILFISATLVVVHRAGQLSPSISVSGNQMVVFKAMFYVLALVAAAWLFTISAILFSVRSFSLREAESATVADGAIYMSAFATMLVVTAAITFPAILMLQPLRLWKVVHAERAAVTPRQHFRAIYPRTYNPSYAISCCMLSVLLASAFSFVFPLLGPAVVLLLFLTLIAHRFLIGYVYARTHSQTGGLLQIWLLKRLGTMLALQPLILGLIFLSRELWIEGGALCGAATLVAVVSEVYCVWRTRLPTRRSLSPIAKDSLETFARAAKPGRTSEIDEESTSLVSSSRNTRARGSFASVLEMMSLTLAVMPSPTHSKGPIPLETETLDDLTATERAARTHPDAPPHLPPLAFADHAEEMSGILYAPELLAPAPVIWLPNDVGGIARSEAYDLQRYHNLRVVLDVSVKEDVRSRDTS